MLKENLTTLLKTNKMKRLLETLLNLLIFIIYSLYNLVYVIWYGKLPKVSIYHQVGYGMNEYSDVTYQSTLPKAVSLSVKRTIINSFIDSLHNYPKFHDNACNLDIPIVDGKGEVYGNSNIYSTLHECADNYTNK